MNPPLRAVGAIAVAAALLAQTWLWIGVMAPPIGYTVDDRVSTLTDTQFFLAGFPAEFAPSGSMTILADAHHFEQDWPLTNGGAVHISEDIPPYAILFGGGLSHDELIAAFHTRAKWKEGTALGGRANALRATIGRVSVSIEAPLSYEDLFRIAESLRPGFAPL